VRWNRQRLRTCAAIVSYPDNISIQYTQCYKPVLLISGTMYVYEIRSGSAAGALYQREYSMERLLSNLWYGRVNQGNQ